MLKQVCLINGSPRGENSCSRYLIDVIRQLLEDNGIRSEIINIVNCQKNYSLLNENLAMIHQSDCLIFVFPLYIDAIPSHMLDFLDQLDQFHRSQPAQRRQQPFGPRVYAIVNNGFIEGSQNKNALNVMRHFANAFGYYWRFGIGIGGGEFLRKTQKTIPLHSKLKRQVYQGLCQLAQDIKTEEIACANNIFVNPSMPKALFMLVGTHGWVSQAKRNHLRKKDIFARP
jgi:multimeric flavodoxin WrbA